MIAGLILFGVLFGANALLLQTAALPGARYDIDLDSLHRAASSGGALPSRIEVEQIAQFAFPRTLVVAGDGFHLHPMVLLSHRVIWADRSVIIDTALGQEAAAVLPGAKFDHAAFVRMERAMAKADSIVMTHEHRDHIGGIAAAPDFAAIAGKVLITREQYDGPKLERKEFAPGALERLKPLEYRGLYTVAPGVVLQRASGHTPGSQLVYVELASGARYLFVGDIAWSEDNIRLQRGRPPIATVLMREDRPAVAAELAAFARLPKDVHLVVAHDPVALARDLEAGLYTRGFSE